MFHWTSAERRRQLEREERQREREVYLAALEALSKQNIVAIEAASRSHEAAAKALGEQAGVLKTWIEAFTSATTIPNTTSVVREEDEAKAAAARQLLGAGMPAEFLDNPDLMMGWVLRATEPDSGTH